MDKKHHHFVAKAYLTSFCNDDGKLCVYFKDKAGNFQFVRPAATAFENYYYSQPLPEGGRDNNSIEDFFSNIETKWTPLLRKIELRQSLMKYDQIALFEFILMHRIRVPTARNAAEKMLAESVKMYTRHLVEAGKLPPPPKSLGNILESVNVAIDPHMSIHAMSHLAKAMAKVISFMGFEILENETGNEFITSDNPVIYFDPTVSQTLMEPYKISRTRLDVEFMFPITPRFMLWGHSILKHQKSMPYRKLTEKSFVERANMLMARFAHRVVFSHTSNHHPLVKKFASRSPVVSARHQEVTGGRGAHFQSIFGKRVPKPKWKGVAQP